MAIKDEQGFSLEVDFDVKSIPSVDPFGVGDGVWLAVSFGGGTNSTAMLCGFRDKNIRPDFISFADTGAEMPHTYEHVAAMQAQVKAWWGIELLTVRKTYQGQFEGLEGQCRRHKQMPSLAYGRRSCSMKYKHEPQERALAKAMRDAGVTKVIRAIGFDANEAHRVKEQHMLPRKLGKGQFWKAWYPLIEWGWRRENCVAAIKRHGLPQAGKSACYFCPAMKKREVYELRDKYPELLSRALEIEDAAQFTNTTKRGLGGQNNLWRNWLALDAAQQKLWDNIEPTHVPCGCYDGG
jgi:3'-phosphoadenosine 5'-phosphosulfate sulfotransferase (PAPS reductase)/FAD synthetase